MPGIPPPARVAALSLLRSQVFQTTYNPASLRLGERYLTEPLRGPKMLDYYPPTSFNWKLFNQAFKESAKAVGVPEAELGNFHLDDPLELRRLERVEHNRRRGKAPPKKGEGRRSLVKKKR